METPAEYKVDRPQPATEVALANIEVGSGIALMHPLELARQMAPFVQNATDLDAQADRAVIDTDEAYVKGTEFMSTVTQQWNAIENLRKEAKRPVDDFAKYVQGQCTPAQSLLMLAKSKIETLMLNYRKKVAAAEAARAEAVRKKQEEEALALAQQEEDKGNTAVAAAIVDAATTMPVQRAAAPIGGAKTNSMGRSTNVATQWVGSVAAPMTVLKAIIDGVYPISMIEFKVGELNKAAKTAGVEGTFHGLKVEKSESLRQR